MVLPWLVVVMGLSVAVVGSWLVVPMVVVLWLPVVLGLVVSVLPVLPVAVGVTVKDGSRVADFL